MHSRQIGCVFSLTLETVLCIRINHSFVYPWMLKVELSALLHFNAFLVDDLDIKIILVIVRHKT